MTPEIIPACSTCLHFKDEEMFCTCSNPKYNTRHVDYIRGEITYGSSLCAINRQRENLCGEAGRGWEARPAPEIPEGSGVTKWFNLF